MNRDGNWEIKDRCCGCPSVQDRHGRTSCLCRAIWSKNLGLKLQQLPHKTEVGGDDASSLLHKLEGFVQFDSIGPHQVSEADGR